MAIDLYKVIEENVVNMLENGIIPWRRCYKVNGSSLAYSHSTGRIYSFLNQWLLSEPGEYWTFNQAKRGGFNVRKGAKAKKVIFWKVLTFEDGRTTVDGNDYVSFKDVPCIKYYNVFHESDIDGLPPRDTGMDPLLRERLNKGTVDIADALIQDYLTANQRVQIITANAIPSFEKATNFIKIPEKSQFDSIEEYYSTLFHEIVHSTLVPLERDIPREREELVAEIGAAFLCGYCNISQESVIKNQASYCANWLKRLSGNIKELVSASGKAEKAVRYILADKAREFFGDDSDAKDGDKENE